MLRPIIRHSYRSLNHDRHHIVILASLLTVAALASCRDLITAVPGGERLAMALGLAGATAQPPRGCAHLELTLSGNDGPQLAELSTSASCGTLKPVIAGTPTYDRQRGLLRVPLALRNDGTARLRAPARLYTWTDSLVVLAAPGLAMAPAGTYASALGADTTHGAGAPAFAGAVAWRFDSLLVANAAPSAQTLGPGATSEVRWLELAVHQGVRRMRVAFWAEARPARAPVPATAPDSVPSWIYDPSNIGYDTTGNLRFAANVIGLRFRQGTSVEQKQAAIDAVNGEVVGGHGVPDGEGIYYVRIEANGEYAPLRSAIDALNARSEVSGAALASLVSRKYRMPTDAGDFAGRWALDPDSAALDRGRWALEDAALPMAWGCSTGDPSTAVAVVDGEFHRVADVTDGLPASNTRWMRFTAVDTQYHGSAVASVLAARGDNRVGMTGAAWVTDLRLYDDANSVFGAVVAVRRAAREGARVINLSVGLPWDSVPTGTRAQRDVVFDNARLARNLLLELDAAGYRPLIVQAAGNTPGLDAFYEAQWGSIDSAQVRGTGPVLRGRVLIVGGSQSGKGGSRPISLKSTSGRSIDVFAPGQYVAALDPTGGVRLLHGTSFAAPIVSGIAALLFAFDPQLSAAEVGGMIVVGALAGGRTVRDDFGNTHELVNAYEALRAAARRKGSPLCGNRVWVQGGAVMAERSQGSPDVLFAHGLTGPASLHVPHGGRQVWLNMSTFFEHTGGAWSPAASPGSDPRGATYWSQRGQSHDRDWLARARVTRDGPHVVVTVIARHVPANGGAQVSDSTVKRFPLSRPTNDSTALNVLCQTYRNPTDCSSYYWPRPAKDTIAVLYAMSPRADNIFIAINRVSESLSSTGSYAACPTAHRDLSPSYLAVPPTLTTTQCRRVEVRQFSSGSEIFRIPIASINTAPWVSVATLPDRAVESLAVSEEGELLIGALRHEAPYWASADSASAGDWVWNHDGSLYNYWNIGTYINSGAGNWVCSQRSFTFQPIGNSTAVPRTVTLPDDCASLGFGGVGDVANLGAAPPPPRHAPRIRMRQRE